MNFKRISVLAAVLLVAGGQASADENAAAKAHADRALSAFALTHYADAAKEYEAAFELTADPALLYNAAQAHRAAGNKERALVLYQSYLRIFGDNLRPRNRADVIRHIKELDEAIASAKQAQTSPATEPAQVALSAHAGPPEPKPTEPATNMTAAPESRKALVENPPPSQDRPLARRPIFWVALAGAAAVVGGGIALGVVLGSRKSDPTPSYGVGQVP